MCRGPRLGQWLPPCCLVKGGPVFGTLVLGSQADLGPLEHTPVALDVEHSGPAYRLGAMLSLLGDFARSISELAYPDLILNLVGQTGCEGQGRVKGGKLNS